MVGQRFRCSRWSCCSRLNCRWDKNGIKGMQGNTESAEAAAPDSGAIGELPAQRLLESPSPKLFRLREWTSHVSPWLGAALSFLYPEVCQVCERNRATRAEGFVCGRC